MLKYKNFQLQILDWKINTVVAGNGPLLLFLHGIGNSWQWWQPTLSALADDFSVCAIDLPGSGSSSPLTSRPYPELYKALVARLIELLDLGPAIVIGHSLGGYVTAQAAIQKAPGIKAIALVAPAGFGPVHNLIFKLLSIPIVGEFLVQFHQVGIPILLHSLVYDPHSVSEDMLRWAKKSSESLAERKQFLYQLRVGVQCGHTTKRFLIKHAPPLSIPISLLWGKHDSVFPIDIAYRTQQVLHAQPPVIFKSSGHFPFLEEPDQFNSALRSFALGVLSNEEPIH